MNVKLPVDWADAGIEIKGNETGNIKTHCPQCRPTRKNKGDKSLSVNVAEKMWNCHHCGWTGRLYDKDFLIERQKKEYKIPAEPPANLSEKSLSWLQARGLSANTIKRFKVTDGPEWMPQIEGESNCIRFPYYRDEGLVNIKYRDGKKNFKMAKDAELIFFNMDSITGVSECVITEGEIDCMSVYEAGYYQVASVPNGASKGNAKLEYLDNCYEAFNNKKRIVIATDGDEPGIMLRNELSRRLGRHRCYFVTYPEGCKDFNEVLLRHGKGDDQLQQGKNEIKDLIKNAIAFPVEGVFRVQDMETELDEYYENGIEPGAKIGYSDFDTYFTFRKGELTTITGIPGSGKSAALDQWLVRLSSRHGWKHAICSFENQPTKLHIGKLTSCFIGQRFTKSAINTQSWDWAKYFINEHFWFFNTEDIDLTIDSLLDKAVELVMRYGIDSLVIDPWNYVEFSVDRGGTETQYVSRALSKILKFARSYDVHVFLVAHPAKMGKKKDGKFEIPNLYSISGSAHFFNKTDNGITVYLDDPTVVVYIQKVRFAFTGRKGMALFDYEVGVGRYAEQGRPFEDELNHYLQRIGVTFDLKQVLF